MAVAAETWQERTPSQRSPPALSPFCPCFAFRCLPPKCRNLHVLLCCGNIQQERCEARFWSVELSAFSSLWFRFTWVKHRFCFYVFVEEEEQSWALLGCADETFRGAFMQAQGFAASAESWAFLSRPGRCWFAWYRCRGLRLRRSAEQMQSPCPLFPEPFTACSLLIFLNFSLASFFPQSTVYFHGALQRA